MRMPSLVEELDRILLPRDRGEDDAPPPRAKALVVNRVCPICGRQFLSIKSKKYDTYTCTKRAARIRAKGGQA